MPQTHSSIAWYYQDDLLARTTNIEEMLDVMKKSIYVRPNQERMRDELANNGKFTYGLGVFSVKIETEIHN